jgi:AcrR family transcriptional regulator
MPRLSVAERRRRLLEAAVAVITRDGVAGVTTRAVVGEAGMPLGAFHYCFHSKHELLAELVESLLTDEITAVREVLRPGRPVRDLLRDGLAAYFARVRSHPSQHQATYELTQHALRTPELAGLADQQYERYLTAAADLLDAVADTAGARWSKPVPVLARMLLTVVDGLTLSWLVDRDDAAAATTLDAFACQIAALARPARARRAG